MSDLLLDRSSASCGRLRCLTGECLQFFHPHLFARLEQKGIVDWKLLVEEWVLGMFVGDFTLQHCMILWDLTLSRGLEVVLIIFLEMFAILEQLPVETDLREWRSIVRCLTVQRGDDVIARLLNGDPQRSKTAILEKLVHDFYQGP